MVSTSHSTSTDIEAHAPYTLTRSSMGLKLFSPGEPAGSPKGISAMRFQVSGMFHVDLTFWSMSGL